MQLLHVWEVPVTLVSEYPQCYETYVGGQRKLDVYMSIQKYKHGTSICLQISFLIQNQNALKLLSSRKAGKWIIESLKDSKEICGSSSHACRYLFFCLFLLSILEWWPKVHGTSGFLTANEKLFSSCPMRTHSPTYFFALRLCVF